MNTLAINQTIARVAALIEAHPQLAGDPVLRRDTLEGETDYLKWVDRLGLSVLRSKRVAEANRVIAQEFAEAARDHEKAADDAREMIITLMQAAGEDKQRLPSGALVSITTTKPAPIITDAAKVPPELCKVEPSMTAIRAFITDTETIPPGVAMSNGRPSLRITR